MEGERRAGFLAASGRGIRQEILKVLFCPSQSSGHYAQSPGVR